MNNKDALLAKAVGKFVDARLGPEERYSEAGRASGNQS